MAHHLRQGIHGGLVDVGDLELRGIKLIACSHAADYRYAGFFCLHDDFYLGGDGIYAVYDIIVLGEIKLVRGLRQIEALVKGDIHMWIDIKNPFLCHIYLVLSNGPPCSDKLAVYICETDLIVVYEINGAKSRTDKTFDDISPDSSDSEYNDPGVL